MAFHVGQRVKKIAHYDNSSDWQVPIGATGTIVGATTMYGREWWVDYDERTPLFNHHFCACSYMLTPLTDPKEESWAADAVRKVTKPEPIIPLPVSDLEHIRGGA